MTAVTRPLRLIEGNLGKGVPTDGATKKEVHEEFILHALKLLEPTIKAINEKWEGNIVLERSLIDRPNSNHVVKFKLVAKDAIFGRRTLAKLVVSNNLSYGREFQDKLDVKRTFGSARGWKNFRYYIGGFAHETGGRSFAPEYIANGDSIDKGLVITLEERGVMKGLRHRQVEAKP